MSRTKWSFDKVKAVVEKEGYILVSKEFKSVNKKIKMLCPHGHEWETIFKSFNRGVRCIFCSGKYRKTTDQYKKEIHNLTENEYLVLGEYSGKNIKIKHKHIANECGFEYFTRPNDFLMGARCPKCSGKMKKTIDFFKKEVHQLEGDKYKVLSEEYINTHTKIRIKHNTKECGYIYNVRRGNFIRGQRCPRCFGSHKKTTEEYKKEIYELEGDNYKVLGEYKGNKNKIKIKHSIKKCGYEYDVVPNSFLRGSRCPKCASSRGEKYILRWLNRYNITHVHNKKYSNKCKNINSLRFDFQVYKEGNLLCMIEYDGEQHFELVNHFGGEEGFKKRQHNDQIKNAFCKDNNIPLIRIPYWEFDNIEAILEKELAALGVTKEELTEPVLT